MKRLMFGLLAVALTATSCASGGGNERSVFVDYSHDEFASFMVANFPKEVTVTPGDTVVFKQVWTGEPHTVTGGTLVNEMMKKSEHWIPFFESFEALAGAGVELPNPEAPEGDWKDVLEAVEKSKEEPNRTKFLDAYDAIVEGGSKLPPRNKPGDMTAAAAVKIVDKESEVALEESGLPWALDENKTGSFVTQNAGQKCFLDRGAPPKDANTPCEAADQEQEPFDGTQTYYNSGVIPYEGAQGNTFRVQLDEDTDPGSYFFYCAVHGPGQYTKLNVRSGGSDVPDQEAVNRTARKEIEAFATPMLKSFRDARDGSIEIDGEQVRGPFAGLSSEAHGSINEFVPKRITTRVGDEVTWKLMGSDHTISFNVPEYFPVIQFARNGKVSLNPKLEPPAGGSPPLPKSDGPPGSGPPVSIDGGTYDGTGFFSSGLFGGEPYAEYTLRFSKAGTYRYACLLHPPMVGTVAVR